VVCLMPSYPHGFENVTRTAALFLSRLPGREDDRLANWSDAERRVYQWAQRLPEGGLADPPERVERLYHVLLSPLPDMRTPPEEEVDRQLAGIALSGI
jgi:hypothetical protein